MTGTPGSTLPDAPSGAAPAVARSAIAALPAQMQALLESIYGLRAPLSVADFVVTDPDTVLRLEGSGAREVPEKLLVCEDEEGLALTLYLDAAVLGRLHDQDPLSGLHRGNLGDFCVVLEGVSHFLYLTWCAGQRRSVSLFELEMQAEVDKYVVATELLSRQLDGQVPAGLHAWLFDECSFDVRLEPEALERYRDASRYAGMYCQRLRRRHPGHARSPGWVPDLRRFYRLSRPRKIRHIVQGT